MKKYKCPVCKYNLNFKPWEWEKPSDEICPSCWIHFWYNDLRWWDYREWVYNWWRAKWILDWQNFWRDMIKEK